MGPVEHTDVPLMSGLPGSAQRDSERVIPSTSTAQFAGYRVVFAVLSRALCAR